jgi:hypothetical protein
MEVQVTAHQLNFFAPITLSSNQILLPFVLWKLDMQVVQETRIFIYAIIVFFSSSHRCSIGRLQSSKVYSSQERERTAMFRSEIIRWLWKKHGTLNDHIICTPHFVRMNTKVRCSIFLDKYFIINIIFVE